jgi:formylglycine-generating enzyme required for sulfatase activity
MVYVQGGTFTMGCTSEQGDDCDGDEKPTHNVTLSSYYMGKFEVTQALWKAVMGSNPSNFKGDNLPVENVSWEDCKDFIISLNAKTGGNFRLPTEAEWEYAARGGNRRDGTKYSGGYNMNNVGWYADNSGSTTHTVGTKSPNGLGIYDMSGNVWEWCNDWYGSYSSSLQTNPQGASSSSRRVLRGGSWYNGARYCRVSFRGNLTPTGRADGNGFRLAFSSK